MNNGKVLLWSIIVALGGFLFGFDTAVISGAEQSIQAYWSLTPVEHGLTVSIALIGTIIGSLIGSIPADRLGRRNTLMIIAAMYLVSSLGTAFSTNWYIFLLFRFAGGLGVGASSVTAPVYISEIAPAQKRGRLVALFQFNVVFGILLSYFSNYLIGQEGETAWRWMLGVQAFPSLLFLILLQMVPESPRWLLLKKGKTEEAIAIFESVGEPWGVAMASIDRATALLWSGATRNGERALVGALADRWQVRDTKAIASALRGLGLAASLGEEHAKARTHIETAFVLSSGITDRLGQARSLELLVPVLSAAKDHRKSLEALGCLDAFQTSTGAVLPTFRSARLEEAIDGIKRQLQSESDWSSRNEATSNSVRDGELDLRFGYGPVSHAASPNELIPSILENAAY